jgi:hypothetical protein
LPAWQSALVVHVVLHAPPAQAKPPWHGWAVGVRQVPPAHVDCAMALSVPEQLGPAPQFFVG